jgi:hypothetical protein
MLPWNRLQEDAKYSPSGDDEPLQYIPRTKAHFIGSLLGSREVADSKYNHNVFSVSPNSLQIHVEVVG